MGILAVPTEEDRAKYRLIARSITDAVVNEEEGPFELPDLHKAKNREAVVTMLTKWYEDWDFKVMRLAQDLGDSSQALDIACALLSKYAPAKVVASGIIERIRLLDIPEQDELDAFAKAHAHADPSKVTATLDPRVMELLDRVTGTPGAVAAALSASEWHELREELETFRYNSVERHPDDTSAG